MSENIYIMTDSTSDLPYSLQEGKPFRIVPLTIQCEKGIYRDGIDISPEECYSLLEHEIPKTSMPNAHEVKQTVLNAKIPENAKILAITVSSGISGTFTAFVEAARELPQKFEIIDTKNIAIGEGFLAKYALSLVEEKLPFDSIVEKIKSSISNSKIFYSLSTLKYLREGGRIGLVSGTIGDILQIKPIISCNEDGVYYTHKKIHGMKRSTMELIRLTKERLEGKKRFYLGVCHGNSPEEGKALCEHLKDEISAAEWFHFGQISPVLGVHTGPGLLGIGTFIIE